MEKIVLGKNYRREDELTREAESARVFINNRVIKALYRLGMAVNKENALQYGRSYDKLKEDYFTKRCGNIENLPEALQDEARERAAKEFDTAAQPSWNREISPEVESLLVWADVPTGGYFMAIDRKELDRLSTRYVEKGQEAAYKAILKLVDDLNRVTRGMCENMGIDAPLAPMYCENGTWKINGDIIDLDRITSNIK